MDTPEQQFKALIDRLTTLVEALEPAPERDAFERRLPTIPTRRRHRGHTPGGKPVGRRP